MNQLDPFYKFLLLILLLSFSGCNQGKVKTSVDNSELLAYLDQNNFPISIDGNKPTDFSPLDSNFTRKRLILLGEVHGSQTNEKLDMELFKYLYYKHGVRYYLGESGYGMGLLINEYLQTGDEQLLKSIFQSLTGTFSGTQENYERLQALRAFNQSLPSYAKIKYVGIDLEQHFSTGILSIKGFLFDDLQYYDKSIQQALVSLISLQNNNYRDVNSFCKYFLEDLRKENLVDSYRRAFGIHYNEVLLILENMIMRYDLHQQPEAYLVKREKQLAKNLQFVMNKNPIGNFYGKWGAFHIWKNNVGNQSSSFIKESIESGALKKDEILSIPIFYENSFYADKNNNYQSTAISSMNLPGLLESNDDASVKVYSLNKKGSPFKHHMLLVEGREGVTTDYFTEFIKIRGSKASNKRVF
ncbi:hypothetical protein [Roseivirga sp.]|uniref:hypothetical protein n=1 Tax=Roseivirga sp. TaxID=1964215 RepID=UPI003B8BA393